MKKKANTIARTATREKEPDPERSRIMRSIKSRHTSPERTVRKMLHSAGYRFRLHARDVPGSPDLVFRGQRKAVFVNGCFWHGHSCYRGSRVPKTNTSYWTEKITRNRSRDRKVRRSLKAFGWTYFTIWECELNDASRLWLKLRRFMES